MSNAENIKEILTKLAQGDVVNEREIVIIKEAIESSNKQSFQVGKYLVNIGKGEGLQIGDQNITKHIYQGNGSETILDALRTALQDFFASQDPSNLPSEELTDFPTSDTERKQHETAINSDDRTSSNRSFRNIEKTKRI